MEYISQDVFCQVRFSIIILLIIIRVGNMTSEPGVYKLEENKYRSSPSITSHLHKCKKKKKK